MKQYQNWLADYLVSFRDGDHTMVTVLAESISDFWLTRDDKAESKNGKNCSISTSVNSCITE